jgi:O-antigen biosynthesis protein
MDPHPDDTPPAPVLLPRAEDPEISLLVPTTNQAEALTVCLTSLAQHLPATVKSEVIVVLNAATPEVQHVAREKFGGLVLLESGVNLGVAGGYNLARTAARGRYLVLLHDDVEIGPGWLEPLLATAEKHPHAGAVGSRVLNFDGSPQRAGSLLWQNGLTTPCEPPGTVPGAWPVDYTGTCSTLVRKALWDALGGMDEQLFPAYYVDVDLCTGLRRLGFLTLCEPASVLRHHSGSSSAKAFRHFIVERNRQYFLTKHAGLLPDMEPWAPDDPGAAQRAMCRTKARAAAILAKPVPDMPPPVAPPWSSTISARHLLASLELQQAWAAHLEKELTESRAEQTRAWDLVERKRQQLEDKSQIIRGLKDQLAALKAKNQTSSPKHKPSSLRAWWRRLRGRSGG